MAIDTSKIEGYDTMTAEEKLDAVLALKDEEENEAVKKANKEAKDRKLELRNAEETNKKLSEQVAELLKQNELSKKARTISKSLGINLEDAESLAESLTNGDADAVCKFIASHTETAVKTAKQDIYGAGDGGKGDGTNGNDGEMTKEKLLNMTESQLNAELAAHPEYEAMLY